MIEGNFNALNKQMPTKKRFLSIDVYKGVMIAFAIFINATAYFQNSPLWNKGSELYGLTYVDLFGPFFLFAMTFESSYNRRIEEDGRIKTYLHFIRRFILYILFGFLITLQLDIYGISLRWGTLQMLGMVGLFLLFTIEFKSYLWLIFSVIFIIVYQIILLQISEDYISQYPHGGIYALLSWFSFATFASILNEQLLKWKMRLTYILSGILCLILGISLSFLISISRQLVNLPFLLISLGISILFYSLVFYIFEVVSNKVIWLKKERFFTVLGKNTLLLYILQTIFKFIPYILLPLDTEPLIFFSFGFLMILLNYVLAYFLDKFQIYLIL